MKTAQKLRKRILNLYSFPIKEKRLEFGLMQKDLAAKTGMLVSTLSQIENGVHAPTLCELLAVALALGVDPSELIKKR